MNLMNKTAFLLPFLGIISLAACSHADKKLDQKVAQEPPVQNRAALQAKTDQLIRQEPGLSDDQRNQLQQLRMSVSPQLDDISKHELQLRTVLMEELLSPNFNPDEVDLIKKRLRQLEDRRLSVTFDGIDKANQIMGHDNANRSRRVMHAMFYERPSMDTERGME